MSEGKRSVLITGCSDGGMGSALAVAFHSAGLHVYATARDLSKMRSLTALGIATLELDIQSSSSIEKCVGRLTSLDILINNAGATYTMPVADLDIAEAKRTFDLNVWSQIAVTHAFLPLLLESRNAIIANHTSTGVHMSIPWQSVYNASKAAFSRFSETLRLELQPFGVQVVELKTGGVKTNVVKNLQAKHPVLPDNSIYSAAKKDVEKALRIEWFEGMGVAPEQWAKEVAGDLLMDKPPPVIWRGESATKARIASFFPFGWFDGMLKKMTGLDKIGTIVERQRQHRQ